MLQQHEAQVSSQVGELKGNRAVNEFWAQAGALGMHLTTMAQRAHDNAGCTDLRSWLKTHLHKRANLLLVFLSSPVPGKDIPYNR